MSCAPTANAPFSIQFSEPIDPATLTPGRFTVQDNLTGANVPGLIQVDGGGRTAAFVPSRPYAVGRTHTVLLDFGVADAAGNRLTGTRLFTFTTAFDEDLERPRLLGISPPAEAIGVARNALVVRPLASRWMPSACWRGCG